MEQQTTQAAQARRVTTIPATIAPFTATPLGTPTRRRVAGYARVSTDRDEQFTSYEAQIDYYTRYIQSHDGWEFVKVYTDEGITGTSTKHREGFKQMVADALDGKIDLIVTKSVSRFARNTVDSLSTIRELKEHGVECYFEKENIWTFDGKGELLITIMSSPAQEESRSISENCKWGQRKRFADGKVTVPFKRFLGYDRGPNGELVVNEKEAETVRLIYRLFLEGLSPYGIARRLTEMGIRTPGGKDTWITATVRSILTNEKYKGDALLQKSYIADYLTKKHKPNEGEIPQFYVEGDHPVIIDPTVFDQVQRELAQRKPGTGRRSGVRAFSGMVKCGECGAWYGSKTWHSTDKYRRVVWQCNRKYGKASGAPCRTPHLTDQQLQTAFTHALREAVGGRDKALKRFHDDLTATLDTGTLEARQARLEAETAMLAGQAQALIDRNARTAMNQTDYQEQYEQVAARYEQAKTQLDETVKQIQDRQARRRQIDDYLKLLTNHLEPPTGFDSAFLHATVETITVHADGRLTFTMKDGNEITP